MGNLSFWLKNGIYGLLTLLLLMIMVGAAKWIRKEPSVGRYGCIAVISMGLMIWFITQYIDIDPRIAKVEAYQQLLHEVQQQSQVYPELRDYSEMNKIASVSHYDLNVVLRNPRN